MDNKTQINLSIEKLDNEFKWVENKTLSKSCIASCFAEFALIISKTCLCIMIFILKYDPTMSNDKRELRNDIISKMHNIYKKY